MKDDGMIDLEVHLDEETAKKLRSKTKDELLNELVVLILRNRVQIEDLDEYHEQNSKLMEDIGRLERDLRQAKAMLKSAIESWRA